MSENVTMEEQEMVVTDENGVKTKVVATVIKTDHGVTDEYGNPKVSVRINVPAALIGVTPGEVN